jgi:hypothetical protein
VCGDPAHFMPPAAVTDGCLREPPVWHRSGRHCFLPAESCITKIDNCLPPSFSDSQLLVGNPHHGRMALYLGQALLAE